ncbi:MAG: type II secretion system F family protein [Planctomycetota bacterium]|jgi:type II secretory pathway component PulF
MSTFEYNALTSGERLMKGVIEAGSQEEASELLKGMQLTVNSIEKAKAPKPKTAIGRNEFLLFNQQLASIAKAGIPLERGLRELAKDVTSKPMRRLIDTIAGELEGGVSIEEAFEKRRKHFPPLYGRILKAGVETGRLSEMLTSLNRQLEVSNQTRRIIFEAISYPAIVLIMASIVITFLLLFVIPEFHSILTEMADGAQLPYLTQAVLGMTAKVGFFWSVVGLLIAGVVVIYAMLSSNPAGRRFKESVVLKIPILGRLCHSSILSKMAEAMVMMVSAGSDMPTTLRLSSTVSGSETVVLESNVLAGQIEEGVNILEAGQFCRVIPRLFLYSIQLGTQRNELQDNLYSLGQMYAEQARCSQIRLQAVFLPTMIILLGSIVATMVLALFLPMIQIVTTLSS